MNGFERALSLMPPEIASELRIFSNGELEEIRIRTGRKPCAVVYGKEVSLNCKKTDRQTISRIIEKATGASYHMAQTSLRDGYISCNGIRIGICGNVNLQKSGIPSFVKITSLAIRIPGERRGICDELIKELYSENFESTLIVSPPGGGKTTALREICRCLSNKGRRVSVVDERNELCADVGDGGFELGEHSDVLCGITKAEGCMMLLRAMNPEIIAMDEITKEQDLKAISQIAGCGVQILATAHGTSLEDLKLRKLYRDMLELGVFKYIVQIQRDGNRRRYLAERINL